MKQMLGTRVIRGALGKVPGLRLGFIPGSMAIQNYLLIVRLPDLTTAHWYTPKHEKTTL